VVLLDAAFHVHQLHGEIDVLGRRVGRLGVEDVLLAQDRRLALDEQPRAGVAVPDRDLADHDLLAGLEFDLERHPLPRFRFAALREEP
jgi:hypothetical protein